MTTHNITRLESAPTLGPLPLGRRRDSANWHRVICSCGWVRRYVSRYRAEIMHTKHADDAANTDDAES
jgi:hypothetical protein